MELFYNTGWNNWECVFTDFTSLFLKPPARKRLAVGSLPFLSSLCFCCHCRFFSFSCASFSTLSLHLRSKLCFTSRHFSFGHWSRLVFASSSAHAEAAMYCVSVSCRVWGHTVNVHRQHVQRPGRQQHIYHRKKKKKSQQLLLIRTGLENLFSTGALASPHCHTVEVCLDCLPYK